MKIREATINDLEELVTMYQDLIKWVYPKREHKCYSKFVNKIKDMLHDNTKTVFVTYNEEITGFSVLGYDDGGGFTEIVLNAEIAYVKEEYRNTRAAYLQYMKAYNTAQDSLIGLMTIANPTSAKISAKRFGSETMFTHIEVPKKKIWDSINKDN